MIILVDTTALALVQMSDRTNCLNAIGTIQSFKGCVDNGTARRWQQPCTRDEEANETILTHCSQRFFRRFRSSRMKLKGPKEHCLATTAHPDDQHGPRLNYPLNPLLVGVNQKKGNKPGIEGQGIVGIIKTLKLQLLLPRRANTAE